MRQDPHDLGSDRDPGSSRELLAEQREAIESVVLAGVRALDEADELRAQTDELLSTAEIRERLIGILGHDLRSPLNAMLMGCGLLMSHGSLTEEDARIVHRIASSGHRMARMITQLAEFTRARLGGGFELDLRPCDLGEICANIAGEQRIATPTEVRHTVEGDLTGAWDADRLSEAVSTLAGNAVDHAAPGTPVVLRAYADGDFAVVEVENQGAGIPPHLVPVLFNPFRRASVPASRTGDHLGLGLYIAHEVARAHGGTLEVRSAEGTTTFTLRLPRAVPPRAGR